MRLHHLLLLFPAICSAQFAGDEIAGGASIEFRIGASGTIPAILLSPDDRKQLGNRPELSADYSDYQVQIPFYAYENPPTLFMSYARAFQSNPGITWNAGIYFRQNDLAGVVYEKDLIVPVDVLRGDTTGTEIIQYRSYYESHTITLRSMHLAVPVGLTWSTDPARLFSFQAGVCVAPGALIYNRAHYQWLHSEVDLFAYPGDRPNRRWNDIAHKSPSGEYRESKTSAGSTGFAGYVSVPITFCLRLSRQDSFYGHLKMLGGIEPAFDYQKYRFLPARSAGSVRVNVGMRFTL